MNLQKQQTIWLKDDKRHVNNMRENTSEME